MSALPASARPIRRRSPCSGSRARRSGGTGSPGRSRMRRESTLGERATVRAPEHGPDGRLHRHLGREVLVPLLATGHRDPPGLRRRQPGHHRRPGVDSLAGDAPDAGLRLGARYGGRGRGEMMRRFFRTDRLTFSACSFTLPAGRPATTRPRLCVISGASPRRPKRTGSPDLRRLPLPRRGRDRNEAQRADRRPGRQPLLAAGARRSTATDSSRTRERPRNDIGPSIAGGPMQPPHRLASVTPWRSAPSATG